MSICAFVLLYIAKSTWIWLFSIYSLPSEEDSKDTFHIINIPSIICILLTWQLPYQIATASPDYELFAGTKSHSALYSSAPWSTSISQKTPKKLLLDGSIYKWITWGTEQTVSPKTAQLVWVAICSPWMKTRDLSFCEAIFGIILRQIKTWKQVKCPLTEEWVKKIWYTHTHKHTHKGILLGPKKEIMLFAAI